MNDQPDAQATHGPTSSSPHGASERNEAWKDKAQLRPVQIAGPDEGETLRRRSTLEVLKTPGGVLSTSGAFDDTVADPYQEGLGEDFRMTPWKAPSEDIAEQHMKSTMYNDGQSSVWNTTDTSLFQMGEGVGLYFVFLRQMLVFALVASLLSVPHVLFCFFGNGFDGDDLDPLKLMLFTAGNHRYINDTDLIWGEDHPCSTGNASMVGTIWGADAAECDNFLFRYGNSPEALISAKAGSYIVTGLDLIMCLAFLLVYAKLRRDVVMLEELADRENVTPSDYAVVVTGLPEDAQDEEVIDHFSSLFRLDQPGWKHDGWGCGCCRMGVKRADRPEHVVDYWGKSIGGMLDPVDSTEHSRFDHLCLNSWLAECSLAHPEGAFIRQARRLKRISRDILQARAAIKRYAEGTPRVGGANRVLRRKAEARLATLQKELELGAEKMESKATSFERTSWKTHAAYIIFNYETSFWRCIHDYGRYPAWLQPRQLRFRGRHRLTVKRAPEPGNIQWENLEESQRQRGGRKLVTALVTLLLLAFSFGVIYLTRIAENSYSSEDSPTEKTCLIDIPGLHGLDEGTPFIGEDSHPLGSSACPDGAHWVSLEGSPYQTPGQPDQCVRPCININEGNELMECGDGALFSPADIGKCFCRQEMKEALKDEWLFEYMLNQRKGQCREFALDYLWEKVVSILASVNVVIINEGLKRVLKKMGTFERSRSVTSRDISVTWKISLALFINSACVVLLVNTPLSFWRENPSESSDGGVGHTWYTSTGKYLVITMTIQTFAPQLPALIYYAIVGPIKRRMAFVALTQQQLNKHWECPRFDLSSRLPFTLMVTAVTMMFSPALPILQPVALVYLIITYFMDKFLLLNMYKKPPHVAMFAIRTMPWMLALHLGFALWTYSEPTVFDSGYVGDLLRTEDDVEDVLVDVEGEDPSGVISRSLRTNCFPFMVLLALLAGMVSKVKPLATTESIPPYTGEFRMIFSRRDGAPQQFNQGDGWVSVPSKDGRFLHIHRDRTVATRGNPDSKAHTGGVMLTWEVLRDLYNLHTYHIEDNEAYRDIVISRNMIAKELEIITPKSPGGKLWSPEHYRDYTSSRESKTHLLSSCNL